MPILISKYLHTFQVVRADVIKMSAAILSIFFAIAHLHAQQPPSREATIKAVFLFNFTQFVEWPSNAFGAAETPFVIGILGNDPFGSSIDEAVQGEKVKGHPLIIRRFQDVKEVKDCQLLYISLIDPDRIKELLTGLPGHFMLTVSDTYNFARLGGMIRFYTQDNKIKLQINPAAAKIANLTISSKLLRLADIVE